MRCYSQRDARRVCDARRGRPYPESMPAGARGDSSMKQALLALSCAVIVAGSPTSGQSAGPTAAQPADNAARVIADARAAMGGDARLTAVKTLVVTGRTRQVRGDILVPIEFEIQAELPDKFARRDE